LRARNHAATGLPIVAGMNRLRRDSLARLAALVTAAATPFVVALAATAATPAHASTADELRQEAQAALTALHRRNPTAQAISRQAKATLVFPKIVKAGLVFGGSYGEGVLFKGGAAAGYYNSVSASWGWQAGAQTYAYVLYLMSEAALQALEETKGWEFGVGPTVVVVNEGVARNLSTTTLREDAYAFVTDQQGLMAGVSLEGTKVTRVRR
jgi:lipid-binding SYLF domain-containing protein